MRNGDTLERYYEINSYVNSMYFQNCVQYAYMLDYMAFLSEETVVSKGHKILNTLTV